MKALITGISGQDGSYLAELLLSKGYEVHGLVRRVSSGYMNLRNIIHLVQDPDIYRKNLFLHAGDMCDSTSLFRIINDIKPDEVYNLAAQADVQESFFMPEFSVDVNANGVVRILEAIMSVNPHIKFYQASTSELFGAVEETPQNEQTRFNPQSPYSIGKLGGYHTTKKHREMNGVFACNGILFNHESERRGDDYVTRKITKAVARIKLGLQKELRLGNLDAKRDWGHSREYVEAAYLMLQQDKPDDYVIGTGETHTVKEWMERCFEYVDLNWKDYVVIDRKLFRPAEVDILQADYSKAEKVLGWKPRVKFDELINIMMAHDINEQKRVNNIS